MNIAYLAVFKNYWT